MVFSGAKIAHSGKIPDFYTGGVFHIMQNLTTFNPDTRFEPVIVQVNQ
jgi:hypothetical protein